MKILKKASEKEVEVKEEKKALDEKKAVDEASVTLTSEEITQLKDILPKIIMLLEGDAEIEIVEDDEEVVEEDLDEEVVEEEVDEEEVVDVEDLDEEVEEEFEVEEEKAEDDASTGAFNADEILKDPAKLAAIKKALNMEQKAGDEKAEDEKAVEEKKAKDAAPAKKVFVKKTLAKKAGDQAIVTEKKANAELVETPAIKKIQTSEDRVIRQFDFHKKH